jgi:hypothetical protein
MSELTNKAQDKTSQMERISLLSSDLLSNSSELVNTALLLNEIAAK